MKRSANGSKKKTRSKTSAGEPQNAYWRAEPLTYFPELPYHPLFAHLLTLNDDSDFDHPEKIGFKSSAVPFLCKVVRDVNCNKSSMARYARYILARIKWTPEHIESLKLLMPIFNYEYPDDESEDEAEEDILDKMHSVLVNASELAIQPLRDYLSDTTRRNRSDAAEILGSIAKASELLRPRIAEILTQALRRYKHEDPEINAFLVLALTDAQAVPALPLIREVYENNYVEEYVSGSWANVLDSMGQEINADDELVDLCGHCGRPTIICRKKENEKLLELFYAQAETGTRLYGEGDFAGALQCFLCTYTLSVRLGTINHCFVPMIRCLMQLHRPWDAIVYISFALGLWQQSAKESSPASRSPADVGKEIEKYYGLRAEAYMLLGDMAECVEDLCRVSDEMLLEADMRALKLKFPSSAAVPADANTPGPSVNHSSTNTPPVTAAVSGPLSSATLVKLGEPVRLSTRSRCCNSVEDVVKIAFDTHTYAFSSTCKSTTVATVENTLRAAVLTEPVDVLALSGNVLATSNPETFGVELWDLQSLHHHSQQPNATTAPPSNGASATPAGLPPQPGHLHTLSGHSSAVMQLECDEQRVVAAGRDLQILIWDRAGPLRPVPIWGHGGRISSMKLRGNVLITAFDCVLLRYTATDGFLERIYTDRTLLHTDSEETASSLVASFDFNDRHLYSVWSHDRLLIHDLQSGDTLARLPVSQPRFVCLSQSLLAYTRKNTKQVHICDLNGTLIDENIVLPGPLLHMSLSDNDKEGCSVIYCKTPNHDLYKVPFVLRPPNGCYRCSVVEQPQQPFKACGKCKSVKYCSEGCQRADWVEHHKKRCRPKAPPLQQQQQSQPPPLPTSPVPQHQQQLPQQQPQQQ